MGRRGAYVEPETQTREDFLKLNIIQAFWWFVLILAKGGIMILSGSVVVTLTSISWNTRKTIPSENQYLQKIDSRAGLGS